MKGIEILTKEPILELSKTLSIICMILFAVFIISLICMFIFILEGYRKHIIIFAIISLVSFSSTIIIQSYTKPTGRYKYKVTIDKSVSMIEVYEKYNVIEQDGKIWTIEDKKNK